MRGRSLHERVDEPVGEFQEGARIERAPPLLECPLGLIGKRCLFLKFSRCNSRFPVEYKSGRLREFENDDLQLCAQAVFGGDALGKEFSWRGPITWFAKTAGR